jgi:hypothetical protein
MTDNDTLAEQEKLLKLYKEIHEKSKKEDSMRI